MKQGRLAYWLFWWCFPFVLCAQEKRPLDEVLRIIEQRHHIHFNYTDETVTGLSVVVPDASATLVDQLESLRSQAPLGFEIIDGYVVVVRGRYDPSDVSNPPIHGLDELVIQSVLTTGVSKTRLGEFVVQPSRFGILPGLTDADVLQTAQQIPGLYSADESIAHLNIRGGTHDQNLFLWNGIRMFQTGHFFGQISAFNPAIVERVTIVKNGTPAALGESVSGVVAVSTHRDSIGPSRFGMGSNLLAADAFAHIRLSKTASIGFSARRSFTDLWRSPTYDAYYDRIFQNTVVTRLDNREIIDYKTDADFSFYDYTLQYRQRIGKRHELLLDGIGIANTLGLDQHATVDNVYTSKHSTLDQQSLGGGLQWKTDWNATHQTIVQAYVSSYRLQALQQAVESNQILQQRNKVLDVSASVEHRHGAKHFRFLEGYQFNQTGMAHFDLINTPLYGRDRVDVLDTHAGYLESTYGSANHKLLLSLGLRGNYFRSYDHVTVEPRLRMSYAVAPQLEIELLGERKSQSASQIVDLQRDFLGVEKRRWTLAEGDIPLQTSTQLSLGASFQDRFWLVSMDNYFKKVDGISSPAQAFRNQLELIRINGDYSAFGSEVLVKRSLARCCAWIAYTFSRNDYDFNGFDPSRFPSNFELTHALSAALVYDFAPIRIAVGARWNSGRPTTAPIGFTPYTIDYDTPNNQNVGDYLQLNASVSCVQQLGKCKLTASASGLNLLDRKNVVSRYYRVNRLANEIESVDTHAMSFTPNLSVRLAF